MIQEMLTCSATLGAGAGVLYAGVLFAVALVSVMAPTAERRKDARATLTILVRRRKR